MNTSKPKPYIFADPPTLKIDAVLEKYFTDDITRGRVRKLRKSRQKFIWTLFKHLEKHGFFICEVHDGDNWIDVKGQLIEAMELIFNLDECRVSFTQAGGVRGAGRIFIVFDDNVEESICDFTCESPFGDAVEAFLAENSY